jgi:predicted nucleic acid-binding protein
MHLAMTGLFRARWSNHIHDEWITSVLKDRADLTLTQLTRTRQLMDANVLDGLVIGYEHRINNLTLPDPGDRHVLAAAIETKANLIVTWNIKDFPENNLKPHGIVAVTPDDFILDQIELDYRLVIRAITNQKESLKNPAYTWQEFLQNLANQGLAKTIKQLQFLILERVNRPVEFISE